MGDDGDIVEKGGYYFLEWKVANFLAESREKDMKWNSPTFYFSGRAWHLYIRLKKSWLGMYLIKNSSACMDNHGSVCYTLGLKAADGTLQKSKSSNHLFVTAPYKFGWSQIVKIKELEDDKSNFCPNETITVYCKMSLKDKCRADAESQTLPHNDNDILIQNFSDLYLTQKLCDVTIKLGDRKFQAHRSILAVRSAKFLRTFEHDMKEKESRVIEIDDCEPDAFHDFLLYLYTAKADAISPKNVIPLYCIANKYDVSQLTTWCETFMLNNLSVELFCDVLVFAMKYNKETLIKAAEDFFPKYMEEILVTVEWQNFMKENYVAANKLLIKRAQILKKAISKK